MWVNTAFGALPSLLNGVANLLCNVLDCALYPLLLTDYLQSNLLPWLVPPDAPGHGWLRDLTTLLGAVLPLPLVSAAARVPNSTPHVDSPGLVTVIPVAATPGVPPDDDDPHNAVGGPDTAGSGAGGSGHAGGGRGRGRAGDAERRAAANARRHL